MKKLVAFVVVVVGVVGIASAADKNDPTGTWKWKSKFGEKEFEQSMKLQLKDGKLTGTVGGFGKKAMDTKIEDAKFKDGEVTFNVTRERGDMKIVSKYSAKVTDDTMKGTITTDFNGKENKREFEAKRVKDEKKKD